MQWVAGWRGRGGVLAFKVARANNTQGRRSDDADIKVQGWVPVVFSAWDL